MMKKQRLDHYLSEHNISRSREKAKKEIMAGWVRINGETVRDPAKKITGSESIVVKRPRGDFVSRGGEKLQKALVLFDIDITGCIAADLGASTGGFTDCMLQRGAKKVYAIDVGYGQLDYKLQSDQRVVVKDRTNVRNLTREDFAEQVDFVTLDLSFISLTKVFSVIKDVLAPVKGIMLLKPQFEADSGEQKKGVVRKVENHVAIISRTLAFLLDMGLSLKGLTFSPITGPAGNIEFLVYFSVGKENGASLISPASVTGVVEQVVEEAHAVLNK